MNRDSLGLFAAHCVTKLLLLEEKLGRQTGYEILDPFHVEPQDPVSVQYAATRIAAHIKLPLPADLVVAFSSKKEGIGGDVEILDAGSEAYIEISPQARMSPAAVCAVLSHEVTHVALTKWGVSEGPGPIYEKANEELTDIAAVFVGLGKLMLNGKTVSSRTPRQGPTGAEVITTRLTHGYLSDAQLALTYRMVCAMRAIPEDSMRSCLSAEASSLLDRVEHLREDWFSVELRERKYTSKLFDSAACRLKGLKERAHGLAEELARGERDILDPARRELDRVQCEISGIEARVEEMRRVYNTDHQHDPCWRFAANLKSRADLRTALDEAGKAVGGAAGFRTFVERSLAATGDGPLTPDSRRPRRRRTLCSRIARIWKKAQKE